MSELLLASQSASRKAMLAAAGVPFSAEPAGVDEESIKQAMLGEGADARRLPRSRPSRSRAVTLLLWYLVAIRQWPPRTAR